MPDVLLDGLPVLDLLEIAPSTGAVARFTRRDQSSVSRIYRQVSERLGLGFRKRSQSGYGAQSNQELLEHLRCASQALRLQSEPAEPRWVLCSGDRHPAALPPQVAPPLPASLQPIDCSDAALGRLLQRRLLDLAVCVPPVNGCPSRSRSQAPPTAGLLRLELGRGHVLLRSDLQHDPALGHLIGALRDHPAIWDG